ncbi:NACHT domain-containing protein [Streptomyces sp. YKOK-I1]
MTRVVRHTPGKQRPRNAPMATLHFRRAGHGVRRVLLARWHRLTIRLEARRGVTRPKKWHRWFTYGNLTRLIWLIALLAILAWCGDAVYSAFKGSTSFDDWLKDKKGVETLLNLLGPVLTASIAAALFLFCWYSWTKHRYLAKVRKDPRRLVLTAGQDIAGIVGREAIAEVIAQRLRDRNTRRPYLLVGGVGAGKTAVLVRLCELLAREHAVPVPIRLRDVDGGGDLDFQSLARQRFTEEAPQGVLARGKNDRVWQQLLADDKPVVIADGLEEALLDDSLQQNRDNIIRKAIERAHKERLPLVIASRPHSPLESTAAAIVELEPLSEEEALRFVQAHVPDSDERRVDWIVETAEVTESPVYLQIARELHRHGALDDPRRLNTRSRDRGTLRLWLLERWKDTLCERLLREEVALNERERRDTVEVVSALACIGLLQDKLEVGLTELLACDSRSGGRSTTSRTGPRTGAPRQDRNGRQGQAFSEWHRQKIWNSLRRNLGEEAQRLLTESSADQAQAILARFAGNADKLGLVEGFEKRVRFPHSIIQAYFGFRVLHHLGERAAGELVDQALQPPGPSRELLIALVLLSRRRAAESSPARERRSGAERKKANGGPMRPAGVRRNMPGQRPRTLGQRLYEAASRRTDDPKALDLFAAVLETLCVERDRALLTDVIGDIRNRWPRAKGDRRTLEDAKLRLLRQIGAVLRTLPEETATTQMYWQLYQMGIKEPSHSIRLAAAQECGAGGNAAFALIRERVGLHTDPVKQYNSLVRKLKGDRRRKYEAWAEKMEEQSAAGPTAPAGPFGSGASRFEEREAIDEEYLEQRVDLFREFVMRAWILPMLLGSVSASHRDEARERLAKWLGHLDPQLTRGTPDLPLVLEAALAQGFKYAANRRRLHPHADPGNRADLIRLAETVLQQSRCWHAQVSLLQALCLWELPDTSGRQEGEKGSAPEPGHEHDGQRDPSRAIGESDAVQTVQRWLSMAGTVNTPGAPGADGDAPVPLMHPFVAEAGDLVALALETGQPERFLWIDEMGVADTIGSRIRHRSGYRKHNLWIPPSSGWSTLDGRAQRLVADILLMLNLIERDGHPDEVEERLARAEQPGMPLPPCIRTNREPLRPGTAAGSSPPVPGSNCLPDCKFQLCPYPPRGGVPRGEIREPFCRQQQALLPGRVRRCFPRLLRRKTPHWVGMRVRELDRFWDAMARRTRD